LRLFCLLCLILCTSDCIQNLFRSPAKILQSVLKAKKCEKIEGEKGAKVLGGRTLLTMVHSAFWAFWNAKSRESRAINLTPPSPFGIHSKQNASMVPQRGKLSEGRGKMIEENCRGEGDELMRSFECQQEKCAANKNNNIIFIINLQLLFVSPFGRRVFNDHPWVFPRHWSFLFGLKAN